MFKTLSQRYSSYDYRGETIRLPLLKIRLISPAGESMKTSALVDSGATVTFIETEIAEALALPHERQATATGAGGDFENWISHVDIEVLKGTTVACQMKGTAVYIPKRVGAIEYCVLGRDSIFQHYNITFRECDQRVVLRRTRR